MNNKVENCPNCGKIKAKDKVCKNCGHFNIAANSSTGTYYLSEHTYSDFWNNYKPELFIDIDNFQGGVYITINGTTYELDKNKLEKLIKELSK